MCEVFLSYFISWSPKGGRLLYIVHASRSDCIFDVLYRGGNRVKILLCDARCTCNFSDEFKMIFSLMSSDVIFA